MNGKIRNVLIGILVLALLGLTVAYSALSQRLDIKSTAEVKASSWNIHFANLSSPTLVGAATVTTAPTLTNTLIDGLDVNFIKPGDSVSYTFDIVNSGSIDAIIDEYKINTVSDGIVCTDSDSSTTSDDATLVCSNLSYTLVYADDTTAEQTGSVITKGTAIAKSQQLKAGQSVSATLTITFSKDVTSLPTKDVKITGLDAYMIYAQE